MNVCESSISKFVHALLRALPKIVNFAELDRFGGTGGGARGLQPFFLTVIAEGTFECSSLVGIPFDDAERTGHYAVCASIAYIRLNEDTAKFGSHNRAGRTRFQAACVLAVFANIGGESPRESFRRISPLPGNNAAFHKLHVAPRGMPEFARVVVGESLPVETVTRKLIPFFAGNFASLASNAKCGIGEKRSDTHAKVFSFGLA